MKRAVVALVLALGAGLGGSAAGADVLTPDPGAVQVVAADTSAFPDVEVSVLAPPGPAGEPVDAGTFALVEAGLPRETTVRQQSGAEQDIVLAIDVSGGMTGSAFDDVRRAAADFVRQAPSGSHIGLVAISSAPQVVSELTTDTADLIRRIDGLRAGGSSAIADSVVTAAAMLDRGTAPHSILVLLTDGADTSSAHAMTDVPAVLNAAHVSLYTVQMSTPETDAGVLQQLSREARGQYATADDTAALGAIYRSVARALGNLYVVRYRSDAGGDTEVVVSVHSGADRRVSAPFPVTLPKSAPAVMPDRAAAEGFWTTRNGLGLGLVAVYLALAAAVLAVGRAAPPISAERRGRGPGEDSVLHHVAERLVQWIDHNLRRRGRMAARTQALQDAGLKMRPGDFITLVGAAAVTIAAVGLLLSGVLVAVLLGAVTAASSRLYLGVLAGRRRSAFADQLDDSVQLLASNLRAGHSLLRALDAVAREADAPTAEEFARVVNETRVGRDLGDSLADVARRMRSEDFDWIAQAIAIHREVGGDLAEVLDQIGHTIRERNQIRRQVKALAAEGKLSAYVLMALPFGIAGFLLVSNPGYLAPFTAGPVGYALIGACLVLLTAGALWLRKLVDLKF
ncbi:type II secretion system F family protein [Rhodococcus sp. SGAir0479]|uniref:type II secretion system F family protein n=1 Tax=Rhodococcus sp. SGAir0479 TaxID=2567884 RepID=UPI0010CCC4C3|nr:type II secretion system F family protein [Rhodococcus sp. SGAir0479]QCQ90662.1 VWA domain-containing protein [Rhodococcus sp. SGAir0479]